MHDLDGPAPATLSQGARACRLQLVQTDVCNGVDLDSLSAPPGDIRCCRRHCRTRMVCDLAHPRAAALLPCGLVSGRCCSILLAWALAQLSGRSPSPAGVSSAGGVDAIAMYISFSLSHARIYEGMCTASSCCARFYEGTRAVCLAD